VKTPRAPGVDARAAAARAITDLLERRRPLSRSLPDLSATVRERDRALMRELAFGTARMLPRLQALVDQLLKKPLRDKDTDVYALLLLGGYQLTCTRIPDHAAIGETVAVVASLRKPWAKALVNGVLRQFQRLLPALEQNLSEAAACAHPDWLFDAIRRTWPAQARDIVAANNSTPPLTLRVNRHELARDAYLARLVESGMEGRPGTLSGEAVYLSRAVDVDRLPGFADGLVSVQDEAAQLAAHLLLQADTKRVLDACCAPGGKACHVLELDPDVTVHGLDIDAERLQKVAENLQRLRLEARLIAGDAARPGDWWDGCPYDAILVDAPCTASGVIRRNPDIKQLRDARDPGRLQKVQSGILAELWACLRPGGTLVYSTCSIFPEENVEVIAAFVQAHPDCRHQPIAADWGIELAFGRQILPSVGGPDGFYYACLRKMP